MTDYHDLTEFKYILGYKNILYNLWLIILFIIPDQVGFRLRKVNKHVDFPLVLDVAPYCSSLSQVSL